MRKGLNKDEAIFSMMGKLGFGLFFWNKVKCKKETSLHEDWKIGFGLFFFLQEIIRLTRKYGKLVGHGLASKCLKCDL